MNEPSPAPRRAVVVGTGFGCRIQVPALRGAGFEVAGLVGSDARRTAERAADNAIPAFFTDIAVAVGATSADVVAISTPPHTHADLSIQALELGCHVLCEKPFAKNSKQARAMADAAKRAGKVNALGNEFRYVPSRAAMTQALSAGAIGEPRFATFLQLSGFVRIFEADFPDWWFDAAEGGGWLGASGSHVIDQIRTWLGEFDTVSASLINAALGRGNVEDSFSVRFRMKTGLEGMLQQSSGSWGPTVNTCRVSGPLGSLWLDGERALLADGTGVHGIAIAPQLILPAPPGLGADERQKRADWKAMAEVEIAPYTHLCRVFRSAIDGTSAPSPVPMATFADGVANMQVLDAIRASSLDGGAVLKVDKF